MDSEISENQEERSPWDQLHGLSAKSLTERLERSPDIQPPVAEIPFERFYKQFNTVREVTETKEWKEVYSHYYEFNENELDIEIGETMEDMEAYSTSKMRTEYAKCSADFFYFTHKYVKIIHPVEGIVPFIAYKYQRRVVNAYEDNRFVILSKFRQGGLTTISVLYALWRCMFRPAQKILTLSKSQREATGAGENVRVAMEHMPSWLRPALDEDAKMEKKFVVTNSYLWFYTPEAARSKSASFIIIDEAAFIPDMDERWQAMYPTIATGGRAIVISTNGSKEDWYGRTYHEALEKRNKFHIVQMDYWEHPLYADPKWVEDTKANIGEAGWLREVLRCFLGSGTTYFNMEIIERADRLTRNCEPERIVFQKFANRSKTKIIPWEDGALWIWQEPVAGKEYVIGVDCAEGTGEKGDNNCFQVLDAQSLEQAAEFYSNNVPPHIFAQIIKQIGDYYNTALVVVENKEAGLTVISYLEHDLVYENLYMEPGQKFFGIKTSKNTRPLMLQSFKRRMIDGSIHINSMRLAGEMSTFVYNQKGDKPEAQRGHNDDAIMAMSLATHIIDANKRYVPIGIETVEEIENSTNKAIMEEIRREIAPENYEWNEDDDDYNLIEDDIPAIMVRRKLDNLLREFNF